MYIWKTIISSTLGYRGYSSLCYMNQLVPWVTWITTTSTHNSYGTWIWVPLNTTTYSLELSKVSMYSTKGYPYCKFTIWESIILYIYIIYYLSHSSKHFVLSQIYILIFPFFGYFTWLKHRDFSEDFGFDVGLDSGLGYPGSEESITWET